MSKEESTSAPSAVSKAKFSQRIKPKFVIICIAVLIVALAPGTYFYLQYQKSQSLLGSSGTQKNGDIQGLLNKIGKLMVLPSNEDPTVATVSDKSKLAGQPFFAKAENGDKVIIYASLSKAILYRPSLNKIIDVATINLNAANGQGEGGSSQSSSQSAAPSATQTSVAIYNSTKTTGLASKAQASLSAKLQGFTVTTKGNAKGEYVKSLIVDISGTRKEQVAQVTKLFNATVGSLPADEEKPTTDILIILGDNAPALF